MALDRIHLRKLLKLFMLRDDLRSTQIRADARDTMRKQDEGVTPGGDFHAPFWADAKAHAAGRSDLQETTEAQIEKNWRREKLYPLLRDGFLDWWNEKRRWTNEPIGELPETVKASVGFAEIGGTVKVENMLCLRVGDDEYRYVYPYFSERPVLDEETARLGIWLMSRALPTFDIYGMRILDVLRGQIFSADRNPLRGSEEDLFTLRYRSILREWRNEFR